MQLTQSDLDRIGSIRTIDLTTIGRRSGKPRRIEIWWFRIGDRFIITGTPGRRDWVANVGANPQVIVHVGGLDIEANVSFVKEASQRLEVFDHPETRWYSSQAELDRLVAQAPMVEVHMPIR